MNREDVECIKSILKEIVDCSFAIIERAESAAIRIINFYFDRLESYTERREKNAKRRRA